MGSVSGMCGGLTGGACGDWGGGDGFQNETGQLGLRLLYFFEEGELE